MRRRPRDVVIHEIARARASAQFPSKVVYDLDSLAVDEKTSRAPTHLLSCSDRKRVGHIDPDVDHLVFESRFECGNLRRATQTGPNHYELILSPDINQRKEHYQWFYFEVSNIVNNVVYSFEVINCLKATSMYSKGMQPVMYSVRDALNGRGAWVRAGDSVCYYRNLYTVDDDGEMEESRTRKRGFYSIRFNVTFRNKGDICYFAYHFPYTFSFLKATISRCLSLVPTGVYYSNDVIGESLGGNSVNLLTVTAKCSATEISKKQIVFLSSRVHPGESNASWMMHGILESLLTSMDPLTDELRTRFIFKLVPMLNPDGVINGSHRCSLSGVDLNRVWDKPSRHVHPEIYHTKAVIQYMCDILKTPPSVFVDLHGHSRRANVFMFGNNPEESWRADDKVLPHNYEFMALPEVLEQNSPAFSSDLCQFGITRGKESSARVTVWRQFGVTRAYTMESTFSGFETGAYKGFQIGTKDLKDVGRELLLGILSIFKTGCQPKKPLRSSPKKKASSFESASTSVAKA
ncbi:zinc carboxypeptidase [Cooperia oncophora]